MKWDTIKDWPFIAAALANIGTYCFGFNAGKKRGFKIAQDHSGIQDMKTDQKSCHYILANPYHNIADTRSLKGQLHCHTTNSDGKDSPAITVAAYKKLGFDFITITDHDFVTDDPGIEGITWIGISVEETAQRKHTTAFNVVDQTKSTNLQDTINYHFDRREMVSFCHPRWNHDLGGVASKEIAKHELLKYLNYNFIEIYNPAVGLTETEWDWVLSAGYTVYGLAVDDSHDASGRNMGWVVVFSAENTKNSILEAMRAGCFYASTGNDIRISVVDNVITASSSVPSNFSFIGEDGRVLHTNNDCASAQYTIIGDESYVRVKSVQVSDAKKCAWSQPIRIQTPGKLYPLFRDINDNIGLGNQLIINGNFDVQTMVIPADLSADQRRYIFDGCWYWAMNKDGGAYPPITASQTAFTPGEMANSRYFLRVNFAGAGANLGSAHYMQLIQHIEEGPRRYGDFGRVLRIDFWARSNVKHKKIALEFGEFFGASGNPSEPRYTAQTFTLTDFFQRYTMYITLANNLYKVFTTNPYYRVSFWLDWGANYLSKLNAASEEHISAAGTVDISRVHIHLDPLDLPFPIESNQDIERQTQRFYYQSKKFISPMSVEGSWGGIIFKSDAALCNMRYPVEMLSTPTIVLYSNGAVNRLRIINDGTSIDTSSVNYYPNSAKGFTYLVIPGAGWTVGNAVEFDLEASAHFIKT